MKVAPSRRWPARFKPESGEADGVRIGTAAATSGETVLAVTRSAS
jgi:hypothetical protein